MIEKFMSEAGNLPYYITDFIQIIILLLGIITVTLLIVLFTKSSDRVHKIIMIFGIFFFILP